MTINVRNKGANGEREVCDLLQPIVDAVAAKRGLVAPRLRRNVEQCQVGGEDIVGLPWYSIEVKRCERVELDKWWRQAQVQATRRASGSTAWDALARGGWRVVEAGAREEAARGSGGAAGASRGRVGGGSTLSGVVGAGQGGTGLVGPLVHRPTELAGGVAVAGIAGGPFGAWARGRGIVPAVNAGHLPGGLGGPMVHRPTELLNRLESAPEGQREPILIWRQNRQPWAVRCRVTVKAGVDSLCIDVDMPLDAWIGVLASELAVRLGG